jgi:phage terminase small subunit
MGARGPKASDHQNIAALGVVPKVRPQPPDLLEPDAAAVWREIVDNEDVGRFDRVDMIVLEALCIQTAVYRRAYQLMHSDPDPIEADKRHPVKGALVEELNNGVVTGSRYLGIMNEAHRQIASLATKLRASEAARNGGKAPVRRKSDPPVADPANPRAGLLFRG